MGICQYDVCFTSDSNSVDLCNGNPAPMAIFTDLDWLNDNVQTNQQRINCSRNWGSLLEVVFVIVMTGQSFASSFISQRYYQVLLSFWIYSVGLVFLLGSPAVATICHPIFKMPDSFLACGMR